ncbi:MAG: 4-hydroxy-3-methylbut-2-enyl diphosphate reductase [Armatimonadota bacterium]
MITRRLAFEVIGVIACGISNIYRISRNGLRGEYMMEVILAESAGFCYGVRRALDTVLKAAETRQKPMFTLGPLIHNPQVIERLENQGIKSVKDLEDIPPGSIVVMPSHGVPRQVMEAAHASNIEIIDLTCPFVSKVHRHAESLFEQGYQVIVLGDKGHTELRGIMSVAGDNAIPVSDVDELSQYELKNKVGVVAQTTQTISRYQRLVAEVSRIAYEVRAYNTICHATTDRQKASLATADVVDVMIIVGGRNSANTRRLAEICANTGVPAYHVEVAAEIDSSWFDNASKVGITAGASTPDWIIDEVVDKVKSIPSAKS